MGIVTYNGARFEWLGHFDERHVPTKARWRWDPDAKVWYTDILERAALLVHYAKGAAHDRLRDYLDGMEESRQQSRAVEADIDVPAPPGCEYMPFQLAGIRYCLSTRTGNALIADEMGLGKTIQALGLINCQPDIQRVLVVCPATVKRNWAREAHKWLVRPHHIRIWESAELKGHRMSAAVPYEGVSVHIVNWDILTQRKRDDDDETWARPVLLSLQPDLLVFDESHKMKNPAAQRTRAALEIATTAKRKLALTGTPIANRPIEAWTTLHMLDPDFWRTKSYYANRYCDAHIERVAWHKDVFKANGASNLPELQDRLRATVMVRRRKIDVLTELPPKRRQIIELDPAKYAEVLAKEADVIHRTKHDLAAMKARLDNIDRDTNEAEYKAAARSLREGYTVAFTELSRVRHETALAKVQDVTAFAEDALESDDKILVFGHHHDVIESLATLLAKYGVVTLTGQHTQDERNHAIDAFQTDPDIRVFIGSTLAAGMGITLTAASTVVFAELDWVPAYLSQAEDRTHRIGQANSVSVYHLVVDGSLDARMATILVEKQAVIDAALDDSTGDMAIKPFEVLDLAPPKVKEIVGYVFAYEELAAIHAWLRRLSALCDGARTLDGAGFNKNHAPIVHSLAQADALTNAQAAVGIRLANFYKGQFEAREQADIGYVYQQWRAAIAVKEDAE